MAKNSIILTLLLLTGLSACTVGPKAFETEPVKVPTDQGDVYCQLYTRNSVTWDRSISHPPTMDVREADDICFEIGVELARAR